MIRKSPTLLRTIEDLAADGRQGQTILLRQAPKGEMLVRQGQATTKVLVIRSGIVKCYITEDNEKEYILEFLGEGEVLGELEAICRTPAMCNVQTLTEVAVYQVDKPSFLDLLGRHATLNAAILGLLAVRLANTATRAARQQLYTLDHSLNQLLEMLEREKIPVTKQDLADYLGISLRSLNRLLRERG
jgi:CRP/FNR family transcriptional regulator, anaerobic regulatory protein